MNSNKTEIILVGTRKQLKNTSLSRICGRVIVVSTSARNLGVILDSGLGFESRVSSVVKSSFYHLRNIARVRAYLLQKDAEILIHALVTSRIDYCNTLLIGVTSHLVNRLQLVQNAAARILTGTKRTEHVTPILDFCTGCWSSFILHLKSYS